MSDVKQSTISFINNLPDNITLDDILDALTLRKKILQGIQNLDDEDYISDEDMQKIIDNRLKAQ
jgi:hypothetical protein